MSALVRYRVKPERVAENRALVRGVYAELAATAPPGFRYATFVLDDGVTFVHAAFVEDGASVPLPALPAFGRFRAALAERCDEPPVTTRLDDIVGVYRIDLRP